MAEEIFTKIGELKGRQDSLESRFNTFEARIDHKLDAIQVSLNSLLDSRSQVKGGWVMFLAVIGVVAWVADRFMK